MELGLLPLKGSMEFAKEVDEYLKKWRNHDSYILSAECPRFGSGEGKGLIHDSVRGKDLYLFADVLNHSITYSLAGHINHMSPDDHFQDLKRMISACIGREHRLTVIMPFLYEGRQHKRHGRESLDCANMLKELCECYHIHDFITFDAHDPRLQNSVPLTSFENVYAYYQFIQTLCKTVSHLSFSKDDLMFIAPDEGATHRSIYLSSTLSINMGMFYKRRDFSTIVGGMNPIIAHEYLGEDVKGKDCIVIDDMISSGESILDVAKQLKDRGAKRVFLFATFGLFTKGMDVFDDAYEKEYFDFVFTTNLTYQPEFLFTKPYYITVPMEEYVAAIIDTLNKNQSLQSLLNPIDRIREEVKQYTERGSNI